MKLDELIRSLRTYEMRMRPNKNDKKKNITFLANTKGHTLDHVPKDYQPLLESFAMFTRNSGKSFEFLKRKEETS